MKPTETEIGNGPHFEIPVNVPVERYASGEIFHMQSADSSFEASDGDLSQIAQVCNESLIYDTLFRARLEGRSYSMDDAKGFVEWAKKGWTNNDMFVFLIRDAQNQIIGAIDIKSNDTNAAEIGYWVSSNVPGIMTNSVNALCDLASKSGYKSLYGMTVPDNEKSQKVLLRAGFTNEGLADRKGKEYLKFAKSLQV